MVEPILPLILQSLMICAKATTMRKVIEKTYRDRKPPYLIVKKKKKNVLLEIKEAVQLLKAG